MDDEKESGKAAQKDAGETRGAPAEKVGVEMESEPTLPAKARFVAAALAWVICAGTIIAASHVLLHLKKVAIASLPEALLLFFIPFAACIVMPYAANLQEITTSVYAGIVAGFIALAIVPIVFYAPSFLGYIEFDPNYAAWVIQQMTVSALGILPGVVVGSAIGGAVATY